MIRASPLERGLDHFRPRGGDTSAEIEGLSGFARSLLPSQVSASCKHRFRICRKSRSFSASRASFQITCPAWCTIRPATWISFQRKGALL